MTAARFESVWVRTYWFDVLFRRRYYLQRLSDGKDNVVLIKMSILSTMQSVNCPRFYYMEGIFHC